MARKPATVSPLNIASAYEDAVGIIDIGSNSVRLVVYDGLKRSPVTILNDKAQCGLGRGLQKTGVLNEDSKHRTRQAVQRFITLLELMRVKRVVAVATAAVRDAADGAAFARELEDGTPEFPKGIHKTLGVKLKILSGEEEARLSALGVVSSIADVHGAVGDLGGGSLELVRVTHGRVGERMSIPIGHFRLMEQAVGNPQEAVRIAEKQLKAFAKKKTLEGGGFYAVGGGFRALAKLHMERVDHPLHVVHQYQVPATALIAPLDMLLGADGDTLKNMPGLSGDRIETIPYTAAIMRAVIAHMMPTQIVFSADGVREGLVFDALSDQERRRDPLSASAEEMLLRSGYVPAYGRRLQQWLETALGERIQPYQRLLGGFALLSEMAWAEHPEYRAVYALERALEYPFLGITHQERAFLGCALYHRYKSKLGRYFSEVIGGLLSEDQQKAAVLLGLTANLAAQLSGSTVEGLDHIRFESGRTKALLSLDEGYEYMLSDKPRKVMDRIAHLLGCEILVSTAP